MTTPRLHLDFETRSVLDLSDYTVYDYARHKSTEVLTLSYAIEDEPVKSWKPWLGEAIPSELLEAVRAGYIVVAHNAHFEWCLWNGHLAPKYGLPDLPFEQMDCTAAKAAAMALPRTLEGAALAMGLPFQKDMVGQRLMKSMMRPRKARKNEDPNAIYWHEDIDRLERLSDYCDQDVEVERALDNVLRPLQPGERELFLLDHKTNIQGIEVDTTFVKNALAINEHVAASYQERLHEVTSGEVQSVSEVANLAAWLSKRLGREVPSVSKSAVENILATDIPEDVREALIIRQEAGKSSVAKYRKILTLTSPDGRMRENLLFHGAATGRLAGKGAQIQNLPSRGILSSEDAISAVELINSRFEAGDDILSIIELLEICYGSLPRILSSCLRPTLIAPPGKSLFVADFSNIEGRVAAWLGGEQWKLEAFTAYDNGTGPDLYKVTAGEILGKATQDITSMERNVLGKIPELACGFGGGVGAFASMAAIYNVDMSDHWPAIQATMSDSILSRANKAYSSRGHTQNSELGRTAWTASEAVKIGWRDKHPGIVKAWYDAEDCAKKALLNPGTWFEFAAGKCAIQATAIGGKMFLVYRLPSGRLMYRADAKLESKISFGREQVGVTFYVVDSITRQWRKHSTYGGDIFQSFVQGIARDLMYSGWRNVEREGFDVVISVHDELGAEGDENRPFEEFSSLMTDIPEWAKGCPVSASGFKTQRYVTGD